MADVFLIALDDGEARRILLELLEELGRGEIVIDSAVKVGVRSVMVTVSGADPETFG